MTKSSSTASLFQYEMLVGHLAWGTVYSSPEEVFELIRAGELTYPRHLSPNARSLIASLLESDPEKRSSDPNERGCNEQLPKAMEKEAGYKIGADEKRKHK